LLLQQTRSSLLKTLATADDQYGVYYLVEALIGLGPTDPQGAEASAALLNALVTADPWHVGGLVTVGAGFLDSVMSGLGGEWRKLTLVG
jgi:hypothetical protein